MPSERASSPALKAQTLRCPQCGAPLALRAGVLTRVVVCAYCDSAVDARDPNLRILWTYASNVKVKPRIPLGTRGTLRGVALECIAFLRRRVMIEGTTYFWSEYLLYNPYKGYRWLVEADNHWTLLKECIGLPIDTSGPIAINPPTSTAINYGGMSFKHFQSSSPALSYCVGEAYWRLTRDDASQVHDYVCPPYLLSADVRKGEVVWSIGEYLAESDIIEAFKIEAGEAPSTVAPCQPNPVPPTGMLWMRYFLYVGLAFLITIVFEMAAPATTVGQVRGEYYRNQAERTQVSEVFKLEGRPSNLALDLDTSGLDNRWAFFKLALINQDTNEAIDFAVEASQYHGVEDGEAWVENARSTSVYVPHVAAGSYFLRVEPESGTGSEAEVYGKSLPEPGDKLFEYTISMQRGVTRWVWLWWVVGLLLPFPIIQGIRRSSFENRRWMESDHPPVTSSEE